MVPCKIIPDKNIAYVCFAGEEHPKEVYEVLRTGTFVWEFATNGMCRSLIMKVDNLPASPYLH